MDSASSNGGKMRYTHTIIGALNPWNKEKCTLFSSSEEAQFFNSYTLMALVKIKLIGLRPRFLFDTFCSHPEIIASVNY